MTENTGAPAMTKRPSWMLSTWVATPFIGARTVVRSRLRWASSSAALACLYGDVDDLAGDVGRGQNLLGADIGVVGGHVAAAVEIEYQPASQRQQRQHHQQERPAETPDESQRTTASRLCFGFRNSRRRIALLIGREFQDRISQRAAPSSAVHRPDFEWRCARFP